MHVQQYYLNLWNIAMLGFLHDININIKIDKYVNIHSY